MHYARLHHTEPAQSAVRQRTGQSHRSRLAYSAETAEAGLRSEEEQEEKALIVSARLDLEPADDVMFEFLTIWFSGCNRGVIELGWTDAREGKLNLYRRFELDDIAAAARFAAETNARPGCSVYLRPATVQPTSKFTRDSDVVQIPGCWADCDTLEAVERVLAVADIMPSAQIVTGRYPALRSQFLWKFSSEPALVANWSRELNRRAQALAGGDPAVINPSTLLRLPGSIAWPWKAGRRPELTEWVAPNGGGHSVTVSALRNHLPEVATERPALPSNGTDTTSELLNPIQALIDQARAGPAWHNPVLKLVAMLVSRGMPSAAILAMAEHLTWPNHTVAQTRDELVVMIAGARRKGFDDGGGVDDVMNVAPKAAPTFQALTKDEILALPDPEWLIPDLVAADTLSVLYGQFRSFKSFTALDWALCLATGTAWYGRTVKQCGVLYIAGEGVAGLKPRVAAWLQHHGISGPIPGFRVIPLAVNLMDKAEAERLILTAVQANKTDGFSPRLIIVDTLHRSMPGGDENSAKDMGLVIGNGALIQRRLGCALLPIHHAGKDSDRGMRGSSGLPGAADTIIRVSRTDDRIALLVEKQKDAEDGQEIRLRAQVVNLLTATGGVKPRSSLVLAVDDEAPTKPRPNLTTTEKAARQYLADLIVAEGTPLPQGGGYPSPVRGQLLRGVRKTRWHEECEARQLSTAETRRNRSLTFRRVFQALLDKNAVVVRDELVWLGR